VLEGTCLARVKTVKKKNGGAERRRQNVRAFESCPDSSCTFCKLLMTAQVRRRGELAEALQGGTGDRPHLAEHLAFKQPDTTSTEQTEQDLARGISCGQSAIPQATAPEFDHISLSIAREVLM
jgi:hypothetical protein